MWSTRVVVRKGSGKKEPALRRALAIHSKGYVEKEGHQFIAYSTVFYGDYFF